MVPAGAVFTGSIFSENLVFQSRRGGLSTESSGGGCYARDVKKKVMATNKDIQKNDRKESGAGLAAGMESENKAQGTTTNANKGSEGFIRKIKTYLDKLAAEDTQFATAYANPEKTIDECGAYIINKVKELKCYVFEDSEIYAMAVQYYNEGKIKVKAMPSCSVVVSGRLSEDELAQARKEAAERVQEEAYKEMKQKKGKRHATAAKKNEEQPTLF